MREAFRSRSTSVNIANSPCWAAGRWFVLLLSALVSPSALVQPAVETPGTLRVALDNAYAPYSFRLDDEKLQGILIDQWRLWEKKAGMKVEIHALDWGEALRRMRAGEFDVIDSIVETPERRHYFDFTQVYATIETLIFFRKDISGITDIASLKGFPVGAKTGDQHIDTLKANGVTTVILFQNNDAIIESAKQHKINVFVVDAPSALYLLNKAGIEADFRHSEPIFRDELRRAVRKGDAALLRTVSEGFAAIHSVELKQINEKWYGRTINRIGRYLTYAGYAAAAALMLIVGLAVWNRTLKKGILQRTAALGESEQRFRRLVELMPVAVYVCDTSGIIQSYNNRAVELWGREPRPGDTAQRYCGSLRLYSSAGKLVPHEESKMAEVLKTGVQACDLEVVIERPDGSRITVLVNIAPLRNGDGELVGAMNCFQDITERKQMENALRQSESQLRLVIDTIPAMAWIVLPTGAVSFINQRWLEYSGLSLEEAIERPTRTTHPEDIPRVLEKWGRDMADGKPYEDEMRLRRADGEYRWFLVRTVPLLDERGNIIEWYGTSTDIEDRKRAEDALRETQALLARVARASIVGELTASIAHEVNQPVGAIVTNAEAALNWVADDTPNLKEAREALQRIIRDGTRASQVVARVRSLLKNGKPNKTPFGLDQMIREIVALTKSEARRRRVSVQTRLEPNLPQVIADRVQVQQVLMNLVMNSLDALRGVAHRPRILRIQADTDAAKSVRVAVEDTGIGIDPHRLKDIFEPFHTTKPDGLGLGLSISRSIVEAHGGCLRAKRNDGPGVTFQFTLPVNRQ
jgi:PAS domain S-box-containing protein